MAAEQVKAFLAKVKEDKALAQKLADAQAAYKGDKDGEFDAVVVPVATAAGFKFTIDDFKAVAAEQGEGEASADELDAVAGGSICIGGVGVDSLKVCPGNYPGVNVG